MTARALEVELDVSLVRELNRLRDGGLRPQAQASPNEETEREQKQRMAKMRAQRDNDGAGNDTE